MRAARARHLPPIAAIPLLLLHTTHTAHAAAHAAHTAATPAMGPIMLPWGAELGIEPFCIAFNPNVA